MEGIERGEAGLTVLDREQRLETLVHIAKDWCTGAEIGRDWQHAVWRLRQEGLAGADVGSNVRAAEAIDCLLGITDQKQCARPNAERRPVGTVVPRRRLAAKPPEDFCLEG